MNKNIIFKALNVFALLLVAVLWLVAVLVPETFGWFNFSYAVVIVCGIWGLSYFLKGLLTKQSVIMKKITIGAGVLFWVITAVALPFAIVVPENVILPLICVIIACAAFVALLITGGKKWDEGDNEKSGYKNYYERKAEEEEKAKNSDKTAN